MEGLEWYNGLKISAWKVNHLYTVGTKNGWNAGGENGGSNPPSGGGENEE